MRLIQFSLPGKGRRLGVLRGDGKVIDITTDEISGALELLQISESEGVSPSVIAAEMQEEVLLVQSRSDQDIPSLTFSQLDISPNRNAPHLIMPVSPSALRLYDPADGGTLIDVEISKCVSSGAPIWIESPGNGLGFIPSIAFVVNRRGRIIGYIGASVVGEFYSLGPTFVTSSEIANIENISVELRVSRGDDVIMKKIISCAGLRRLVDGARDASLRDGSADAGNVILIELSDESHGDYLGVGDIAEVLNSDLGRLWNPIRNRVE